MMSFFLHAVCIDLLEVPARPRGGRAQKTVHRGPDSRANKALLFFGGRGGGAVAALLLLQMPRLLGRLLRYELDRGLCCGRQHLVALKNLRVVQHEICARHDAVVDAREKLEFKQIELDLRDAANLGVVAVCAERIAEALRCNGHARDDESVDGQRVEVERRVALREQVDKVEQNEQNDLVEAAEADYPL